MNEVPSAMFRKTYAKLTEPTTVTVNGHVIGQWIPAGATIPVREYAAWIPNSYLPEVMEKVARANREVTKLPGGGIQARQSQRDELLRKINRSK